MRERLATAKTQEELTALILESVNYRNATPRTEKLWGRAVDKRWEELKK